jgi:hypothetical protein
MSTPSAKDLLAQADRLMRQRTPEELPVLTDLVVEEIEFHSLPDRMDEVIPTHSRPAWAPTQAKAPAPPSPPVQTAPPSAPMQAATARIAVPVSPPTAAHVAPPMQPSPVANSDLLGMRPPLLRESAPQTSSPAGPNTITAAANVREQFNAQLITKLEELQHGVYSQVMQQLELHAGGSLKEHIRKSLEPALIAIAGDIAQQVAEDAANQVREVLSRSVDAEITRLREQLSKRRF